MSIYENNCDICNTGGKFLTGINTSYESHSMHYCQNEECRQKLYQVIQEIYDIIKKDMPELILIENCENRLINIANESKKPGFIENIQECQKKMVRFLQKYPDIQFTKSNYSIIMGIAIWTRS